MKAIDEELINQIPDAVEPSEAGCTAAADSALLVLFLIGEQFKQFLTFPPIFSTSGDEPVEVWPLPPPYMIPLGTSQLVVESNLNELLRHTKLNAKSFNEEVAINNVPGARSIADMTPKDSAMIWHLSNDLARLVLAAEHAEDAQPPVYRTIDLSEGTEWAYVIANTMGLAPPVTEEQQREFQEKIDEIKTRYQRNLTYEDRNPSEDEEEPEVAPAKKASKKKVEKYEDL